MRDWRLTTAIKYTQSSSGDRLVSFTSFVSISGLALGVAVLIVVLSVINGFEKELRNRVLGVLPHAIVFSQNELQAWPDLRERILSHPEVISAAPYLEGVGLVVVNKELAGISYFGVDPAFEKGVSIIGDFFIEGDMSNLTPGSFKVALGIGLAEKLGLGLGDKLTLVLPDAQITLAGPVPRTKRFTVGGIYQVGSDADKNQVLINIEDGLRLNRRKAINALRLKVHDLFDATFVLRELLASEQNPNLQARSWMRKHGNLYAAIQTQKTTMFLLLLMLVAVAAFNVISNLIMVVNEKQGDIAILRTMGATTKEILAIFMAHGIMIGAVGVFLGVVLGIVVTINLSDLYMLIDNAFSLGLMDEYFIHYLPTEILVDDVLFVSLVSLFICFVVTIYPARVAAKSDPIKALQYE